MGEIATNRARGHAHSTFLVWVMAAVAVAPLSDAGAQAPTQVSGPQASDEIVVTGQRDREEAIHEFLDTVTVEANGQMATFRVPVCPASFGLPASYNMIIADRVREIAAAADIPLAEPGCDPNLIVIVANDSRSFFDEFREQRPTLFHTLDLSEIMAIAEAKGPVRSWQVVELRGSDGRKAQRVSFIKIPGQGLRYIPKGYMLTGVRPSRIQKATRYDLAISFVVFDLAATNGLTLTQLADHAAMRTLARTDAAEAGAPSILALFQEGAYRADGLTPWDAAYLKSLYATNNTVSASQQQANMARLIGEALDEEEPVAAN